eukprot:scaffold21395_cov28-Prasinocladus_malaysianus.AAC.1
MFIDESDREDNNTYCKASVPSTPTLRGYLPPKKRNCISSMSRWPKECSFLTLHTLCGAQSNKIMMVLASNRPEDLDPAVLDRIDDTIHFPLPGGPYFFS